MTDKINVALVGATSLTGEALVELLQEHDFPVAQLYLLDGEDEAGGRVEFNKEQLRVEDVATFDFSKAQLVLFAATTEISQQYVPVAAEAGCYVVDRTPAFRNVEQIPLVVAAVNDDEIKDNKVITSPCCVASMLGKVLKPLVDQVGLKSVSVATYQAVSGAGKQGLEEIGLQTAALLNFKELKTNVFPHQIAFNVIPQIGAFTESGYTVEELKIINETRKILGQDDLHINATAVRVPVFYGHSVSISLQTGQGITASEFKSLLAQVPGIEITDEDDFNEYPTPVTDAVNQETVYVGRVRQQPGRDSHLELWVTADNIRSCAAANMLSIAKTMLESLS